MLEPGSAVAEPQSTVIEQETLPRQEPAPFGLLGSIEFETFGNRFLDDWQSVTRRYRSQRSLYADCVEGRSTHCAPRLVKWRKLIASLRSLPPMQQIRRLNRQINNLVRYADDRKAFGRLDYWADPVEFIRSGGDCEDYATLKFFSLLELGFRHEHMRIAIVKDVRRNLLHAVLSVSVGETTYILDSLYHHAAEEKYLLKYKPVYSYNLKKTWSHIVTRQIRVKYVEHHFGGPEPKAVSLRSSPMLPQREPRPAEVQESRLDICTVGCGRDIAVYGLAKAS